MSARAGTPLARVEEELAARGQMLAFEPIDLGPVLGVEPGTRTMGGVFATNLSGARRVAGGAVRDHAAGHAAPSPARGELFKSGGRVMKNVTGYDLTRGLSGSWGTLAVLTRGDLQGACRCPRRPARSSCSGSPDEIAVEALCAAMGTPFEVSGAVHLQPAAGGASVARGHARGSRRR